MMSGLSGLLRSGVTAFLLIACGLPQVARGVFAEEVVPRENRRSFSNGIELHWTGECFGTVGEIVIKSDSGLYGKISRISYGSFEVSAQDLRKINKSFSSFGLGSVYTVLCTGPSNWSVTFIGYVLSEFNNKERDRGEYLDALIITLEVDIVDGVVWRMFSSEVKEP